MPTAIAGHVLPATFSGLDRERLLRKPMVLGLALTARTWKRKTMLRGKLGDLWRMPLEQLDDLFYLQRQENWPFISIDPIIPIAHLSSTRRHQIAALEAWSLSYNAAVR